MKVFIILPLLVPTETRLRRFRATIHEVECPTVTFIESTSLTTAMSMTNARMRAKIPAVKVNTNAAEDRCGGQEHECINDVYNYKCGCKNGLVQMWDSENEVFTCESDFCAEAGSDVCGGDPSECVNVYDLQDYICNHCPAGYTHNESNKCIDVNECLTENVCEAADEGVNAVQCVNVP